MSPIRGLLFSTGAAIQKLRRPGKQGTQKIAAALAAQAIEKAQNAEGNPRKTKGFRSGLRGVQPAN